MVFNFLSGGAAINVLCRHYDIQNVVIDVGVDHEFPPLAGLLAKKIARGTEDFLERPAMTEEQAIRSIQAGMDLCEGYELVGTGEMGIGNTTSSSAILAVLLGLPVEEVVGRGTGIDDVQAGICVLEDRGILERKPGRAVGEIDAVIGAGD